MGWHGERAFANSNCFVLGGHVSNSSTIGTEILASTLIQLEVVRRASCLTPSRAKIRQSGR